MTSKFLCCRTGIVPLALLWMPSWCQCVTSLIVCDREKCQKGSSLWAWILIHRGSHRSTRLNLEIPSSPSRRFSKHMLGFCGQGGHLTPPLLPSSNHRKGWTQGAEPPPSSSYCGCLTDRGLFTLNGLSRQGESSGFWGPCPESPGWAETVPRWSGTVDTHRRLWGGRGGGCRPLCSSVPVVACLGVVGWGALCTHLPPGGHMPGNRIVDSERKQDTAHGSSNGFGFWQQLSSRNTYLRPVKHETQSRIISRRNTLAQSDFRPEFHVSRQAKVSQRFLPLCGFCSTSFLISLFFWLIEPSSAQAAWRNASKWKQLLSSSVDDGLCRFWFAFSKKKSQNCISLAKETIFCVNFLFIFFNFYLFIFFFCAGKWGSESGRIDVCVRLALSHVRPTLTPHTWVVSWSQPKH